jgi:hypothetical protein
VRARGGGDGIGERLGGERGEEAVPAAAEERGKETVDVARGDGAAELDERGERWLMRRGKGRGLAVAAGERHGWPGGGVERSKRHQRSTGRLYLTFYHYNGIVTL